VTDYLEQILDLLRNLAEQEQDWPERKIARVFRGRPEEMEFSALDRSAEAGLLEGEQRSVWEQTAEAGGPRGSFFDPVLQADRLETLWDRQEDVWNILPGPARNQEAAPGHTPEEETRFELLTREFGETPAQSGGAAKGNFPLLEQLRRSRQAVENSRRRDALRGEAQVQPAEQSWEKMARTAMRQTQAQDTAQLVDRAFRRDARRYDGGFTLF